MSFLSALLSRSQNQISTRQALMVVGLQNDFTSPEGKLPVNSATGYLDRIRELVPAFREHGEIFWITTQYRGKRTVNNSSGSGCMVIADDGFDLPVVSSDDEMTNYSSRPSMRSNRRMNEIVQRTMSRAAELEADLSSSHNPDQDLFLSQENPEDNCCIPGSWGAELSPEVRDLVSPKDVQIVKSYYSAFTASSLLLMLRAKLITEVYVVGCTTNLSVYATALDAAQHGLTINLVEDCLNYRLKDRHDRAIQKLVDIMGASVTTSSSVMSRLRGEPQTDESGTEAGAGHSDVDMEDQPGSVRESFPQSELERHLEALKLNDNPSPVAADREHTSSKHAKFTSSESTNTTSHRHHSSSEYARVRRRHNDSQNRSVKPESRMTQSDSGAERHEVGSVKLDNPGQTSEWSDLLDPDVAYDSHSTVSRTHADDNYQTARSHQSHSMLKKTMSETQSNEYTKPTATQSPRVSRKAQMRQKDLTMLGSTDTIGSGDSRIIYNLIEPKSAKEVFPNLFYRVRWQRMYHAAGEVPRLVCCQGDIDEKDGSMPVYRHPADQSLPLLHWDSTVAKIKSQAEERVGHKLNHALIQLYRGGQDYISEHSDKTLDIVRGSKIVNVSLGAQRIMRLRNKRPALEQESGPHSEKQQEQEKIDQSSTAKTRIKHAEEQGAARVTQRIPMPHNSMFVMGHETNANWLHGIMPDKRPVVEQSPAELAYGGMRISLTFRQIGTFLSSDSRLIWGQGAVAKEKVGARPTINNDGEESQKLINAFGFENQSTAFDWDGIYGTGFDVLHLKSALPEQESPILFLSGREYTDTAVKMYLSHLGINADLIPPPSDLLTENLTDSNGEPLTTMGKRRRGIYFRDTDRLHTQVRGKVVILHYLERTYAREAVPHKHVQKGRQTLNNTAPLDRLQRPDTAVEALRNIEKQLEKWEGVKKEPRMQDDWFAGPFFSIADCAYWPLVRERRKEVPGFAEEYPRLERWARKMEERNDQAEQ